MEAFDYEAIRGFLIGRCGKSERECFYISTLEYLALRDGLEKAQRERYELARWEKFIDAQMNGFLKRKPNTPEELFTFPWEKKKPEAVLLSNISETEAQALTNIFKQANF